ncbi:hypothetical protein LP092_15100 (plasmid) [Moraxella bovis]|uniref:Uncharacterized protein n=2 Tax=Moraxella bovis TaxID=476 RepID=A0ABY6MCH8_MORBO|nr:hypothetical protein LP092_15100 [Moraxella bovis]
MGDIEYFYQATHIKDNISGENYIIGLYQGSHNGLLLVDIMTHYYANDRDFSDRIESLSIGPECIFYKLGINNKALFSHIDGDNNLSFEQLSELLSLDSLKNLICQNQSIMPTQEFKLVLGSMKQAGFDQKEVSFAQTEMLSCYNDAWDKLNQYEKYEWLVLSVGDCDVDDNKYLNFLDILKNKTGQDFSYLRQSNDNKIMMK